MNLSPFPAPRRRIALGVPILVALSQTAAAHPGERRDDADEDHDGRGDYARVLEARPRYVDVRVDVPTRECWQAASGGDERGRAGATLLGGLLGGIVGHQLGDRDDRAVTTAAGVVVGGLLGHAVADPDAVPRGERGAGEVERCRSVLQPRYERRIDGYDVTYEYAGRRYRTHLPYDPGPRLDVAVDVAPAWR